MQQNKRQALQMTPSLTVFKTFAYNVMFASASIHVICQPYHQKNGSPGQIHMTAPEGETQTGIALSLQVNAGMLLVR